MSNIVTTDDMQHGLRVLGELQEVKRRQGRTTPKGLAPPRRDFTLALAARLAHVDGYSVADPCFRGYESAAESVVQAMMGLGKRVLREEQVPEGKRIYALASSPKGDHTCVFHVDDVQDSPSRYHRRIVAERATGDRYRDSAQKMEAGYVRRHGKRRK